MSKYTLLTVDLNNDVSAEKRFGFYEYLEKKNWGKILNLTTTWMASWDDIHADSEIIRTAKKHVEDAAEAEGIASYSACVGVSLQKPETWHK